MVLNSLLAIKNPLLINYLASNHFLRYITIKLYTLGISLLLSYTIFITLVLFSRLSILVILA
jgi:hypothetical protein